MKIGLVSKFPPEKCGIGIYSNNLLKKLRCKVVTIGTQGSKCDYKLGFKSFGLKKDLAKIIDKEKLDLIHFQHVGSYFSRFLNLNFLLALKQKVPVVVTLHEIHYTCPNIRDKVLCWIEKKAMKRATKVIVHTPQQKRFLENVYGARNVVCIYHGLELYRVGKRKDKNILFFGVISRKKGLEYLIKAMEFLPECKLTIAGSVTDTKYKKELIDMTVNKGNIKTRFEWIPEKQRWNYYRRADLVVLPHLWAPFQSGILHNAISVGLPVVVTKVGSLWEMVDLFKFGEIVEPKDPEALAVAIKNVYKNYDKYQKGIIKYRKLANWSNIAKQHLNLYKTLLR